MRHHILADLRSAWDSEIGVPLHFGQAFKSCLAAAFGERIGRDGNVVRYRGTLYLLRNRRGDGL